MPGSVVTDQHPQWSVRASEVSEQPFCRQGRIGIRNRCIRIDGGPGHLRGAKHGCTELVVFQFRGCELHTRTGPIGRESAELGDSHVDPELGDLGRKRFAEAFEAPLTGVVQSKRWHRTDGADSGNLHDVATTAFSQVWNRRLGNPDCTEEIQVEMIAGLLLVDFFDGSDKTGARVVDHNVEATEDLRCMIHSDGDRGCVTNVEEDFSCRVWVVGQQIRHGSGMADSSDDAVTLFQSGPREFPAETAANTGDEPGPRSA